MFRTWFVFVLSIACYFGLTNTANGNVLEEEVPRLQFPVISDTHICGEPQTLGGFSVCQEYQRDNNLLKAMEDYRQLAPAYKAIAIVGDLTNHGLEQQYNALDGILDQYVPSYTEKIFAIGNHEYFEKKYNRSLEDSDMINRFLSFSGRDQLYYDSWIYGYHFIVLGSESTAGGDYNSAFISDEQYGWLEQTIAVNASENKPIFVFLHQSIKDTIYGSKYWSGVSDSRLADILRKYPQSILFTGHSHYLLDHPRTVYQNGFTMVNTGAVAYGYYDGGDLDNKSQGLMVNVYNNRVDIKARDFGSGSWVNEYSIEIPYRKTYEDTELPYFINEAAITVDSIDYKSARISWESAVDNEIIEKYQIYANGKLKETKYPRYWEADRLMKESADLIGLNQHTLYEVEVIAIDGYGNRTLLPLTTTLQTPWTHSGWVSEDGNSYYYDPETGAMKIGWADIEGERYYMDESGIMQTEWKHIGGKWYYLNDNGVMQTGWKFLNGKWYYMDGTGAMKTGWESVNGNWYYLSPNGSMITGWLLDKEKWYFFTSSGAMKTGWLKSGAQWYYMTLKGMATGWSQIGGKWYHFDKNGSMKTGWVLDNKKWYYLEDSGIMKTDWLKYNNAWYFLERDGSMSIGWRSINNKWYYFYENGKMASGTTINGYKLGKDGAMY